MEPKQQNVSRPQPVKLQLGRPITTSIRTVHEVTVQEPRARHFEMFDALGLEINQQGGLKLGGLGSLARAAAEALTDLEPPEVDELALTDLLRIGEAVLGFFGFGDEIGGMLSGR